MPQECMLTGRITRLATFRVPEFGTRARFHLESAGRPATVCAVAYWRRDTSRHFVPPAAHRSQLAQVLPFTPTGIPGLGTAAGLIAKKELGCDAGGVPGRDTNPKNQAIQNRLQ